MSVVRGLTYYIYIILDLYYFRILDSYYNANILTCTVQVNHIHKLLTSGCCSLERSSEQTLGSWYNSQIIEGSRVSRDTMIAFLQLRDIHHYSAFFPGHLTKSETLCKLLSGSRYHAADRRLCCAILCFRLTSRQ